MYIKRSKLDALKESKEFKRINENYNKRILEHHSKYDIFLSHATDDKEVMQLSKAYFEQQGKTVYVAEIDDFIPHKAKDITKEHVEKIQHAMDISNAFYYVLSKCEKTSTWMPWELGYFDGKYGKVRKIGVLSIYDNSSDDEKNFEGHEYLKLYPHKEYDKIATDLDLILEHLKKM